MKGRIEVHMWGHCLVTMGTYMIVVGIQEEV